MNQLDRVVRAKVYELFVDGFREIDAELIASVLKTRPDTVVDSLSRLANEHRLVLGDHGRVRMAHPFSGVDTGHRATSGDATWWANCAWDALAILSLIGDGVAVCPDGPEWTVQDGVVSPDGIVHLLVPAESFWDDVVFT